eukprot:6945-Pelagococcus_subviridis.AAC.1
MNFIWEKVYLLPSGRRVARENDGDSLELARRVANLARLDTRTASERNGDSTRATKASLLSRRPSPSVRTLSARGRRTEQRTLRPRLLISPFRALARRPRATTARRANPGTTLYRDAWRSATSPTAAAEAPRSPPSARASPRARGTRTSDRTTRANSTTTKTGRSTPRTSTSATAGFETRTRTRTPRRPAAAPASSGACPTSGCSSRWGYSLAGGRDQDHAAESGDDGAAFGAVADDDRVGAVTRAPHAFARRDAARRAAA